MAANNDVRDLLQRGIEAAKRGDKVVASDLLQQVVELDERNEQAWLWLSGVVESPDDMRVCLENVLEINPNNNRALTGLHWLEKQQGVSSNTAVSHATSLAPPEAATSSAPPSNIDAMFPTPATPALSTTVSDAAAPAFDPLAPASPFAQQPPASPFAQQPPASPFAQQPPASPFAPAPTSSGQYLPFGQTAPPPAPAPTMPEPEPPPAPPAPTEEVNPFLNRRPTASGLAGRLGGASSGAASDDISSLRSSLLGGGQVPRDDNPSSGSKRNEGGFSPSATVVNTFAPSNPSASASPFVVSGQTVAVADPFATSTATVDPFAASPVANATPFANPFAGNGSAAVPVTDNPFANASSPVHENGFAPASQAEDNPFAAMSSGNGFAPAESDNPFGISSELRPFSLQDVQDEGAINGEERGTFVGSTPFGTMETRPPVFTPRPAEPQPPPKPRGLAARAGLDNLTDMGIADPFGPPPGAMPAEIPRPSSPSLISRPPIVGNARTTPPDVVTFPCPNCRKLVPENALSCPQCSFQFYARCPNCGEYVDTTVQHSTRGDHCPNCGVAINLMELGRAGSNASAAPLETGNIRPRSNLKGEEGMSMMMPVKGLVEPTKPRRRLPGVGQIFALLIIVGIIVFLLWAKDNIPLRPLNATPTPTTRGQVIPMQVQADLPRYILLLDQRSYYHSLGSSQAVFSGCALYV